MTTHHTWLPIAVGLGALLSPAIALADLAPPAGTAAQPIIAGLIPMPPPRPMPQLARVGLTGVGMDPGLMCRRAVTGAGRAAGIPDHLMSAIARVESGRRGADGQVQPWPWSINAEGTDHVFETRDQAISAVRALQAQGVRSIDIGCMQVNLMHHPTAFRSLESAFDPTDNAVYAAHFLRQLFDQTGSWPRATAAYHSATPDLGDAYQRKVESVLAEESSKDIAMLGTGGTPMMRSGLGMPAGTPGTGAVMLGNNAQAARIIPLANAGMGRDLAAYRAAPVRVAARGQ